MVNQGTYGACQGRGKFDKFGGGSCAVLIAMFMVPFGYSDARPIAQALRPPVE